MRPALALACLSVLLPACGSPPPPQPPRPSYDVPAAVARLVLPPDDRTRAALADLHTEARGGDQAARRARALFLLDLFDYARFSASTPARRLLFEELGGSAAAPGGEIATEWVAQHLDAELQRVTEPDADVRDARALLAVELSRSNAALVRLLVPVKRLARRPHAALRANAILRLYGFCARALRDAAVAPRPARAMVANHCLYTLYDSDPAAYFDDDPEQRPPDPPWTAYRAGLVPLLDTLGRTRSRLAPLADRLAAADRRFFADLAPSALPLPVEIASLGLPAGPNAPLWDRTPLARLDHDGVSLGGTPIVDDARLRSELALVVTQDPRRTVTVLASSNTPAQRVVLFAETARRAGARVLELGVAQPVTLKVPPGDYWAGRTVARLGVLPVSLAPLAATPVAPPRDDPRAARWDPARDELGLTLTIDDHYLLAGRDGRVGRLPADPAALRTLLARVRRAYPDQSALAIAVTDRPTYADLVTAVEAARHDARGVPLLPALALLPAPPRVAGSMETRIAHRAAVEVQVLVTRPGATGAAAPAGAAVAAQVRRCFLAAVDHKGTTLGRVDLEVGAAGVALARHGGREGPRARGATLLACVRERLAQARAELPGGSWPPGTRLTVTPRPAR